MTKDEKKSYDEAYYRVNMEKKRAYNKAYNDSHIEEQKAYREVRKEIKKLYDKSYQKRRLTEDINYKLRYNLRRRLVAALKIGQKSGSAVRDLGCSIEFLKQYLEERFQPGMSWDDYGLWHIDHIMPLASFNLTDREQFLQACHYTNLQPLWAEENMKKGDKYATSQPEEKQVCQLSTASGESA
jgi:hypothetical protein